MYIGVFFEDLLFRQFLILIVHFHFHAFDAEFSGFALGGIQPDIHTAVAITLVHPVIYSKDFVASGIKAGRLADYFV